MVGSSTRRRRLLTEVRIKVTITQSLEIDRRQISSPRAKKKEKNLFVKKERIKIKRIPEIPAETGWSGGQDVQNWYIVDFLPGAPYNTTYRTAVVFTAFFGPLSLFLHEEKDCVYISFTLPAAAAASSNRCSNPAHVSSSRKGFRKRYNCFFKQKTKPVAPPQISYS